MEFRMALLDSLRGTEITIPDLHEILTGWTQGEVNPNYHRLLAVSDKRLNRYLPTVLSL
jgi:hypothetical protein